MRVLMSPLHLLHCFHVPDLTPEVDEDVNDEHDVHDEIYHVERRTGVNTTLHGCIFLRRENKERLSKSQLSIPK